MISWRRLPTSNIFKHGISQWKHDKIHHNHNLILVYFRHQRYRYLLQTPKNQMGTQSSKVGGGSGQSGPWNLLPSLRLMFRHMYVIQFLWGKLNNQFPTGWFIPGTNMYIHIYIYTCCKNADSSFLGLAHVQSCYYPITTMFKNSLMCSLDYCNMNLGFGVPMWKKGNFRPWWPCRKVHPLLVTVVCFHVYMAAIAR